MEDKEHGRTYEDEDEHGIFIGNKFEIEMKEIADEQKHKDATPFVRRSKHSLIHT